MATTPEVKAVLESLAEHHEAQGIRYARLSQEDRVVVVKGMLADEDAPVHVDSVILAHANAAAAIRRLLV